MQPPLQKEAEDDEQLVDDDEESYMNPKNLKGNIYVWL